MNAAFIKTIASNFEIGLKLNRKHGYSVFICEISNKRWMMVDMKDQADDGNPHLIIVIDIKANSMSETEIESLSQIPGRHSNIRRTCFWINKNRDAIHMMWMTTLLS
ncbi:hypothetical protein [Radiobacillus sp. PE A8.2]|uniref:hypothetical protein n=1 Tax=Radiobacillus sp. PE A8.2 TaxID=3380349 RepID=UPI003890CB0F